MSKNGKTRRQTIQDEADAELREGERQAAIDKARAQTIIDDAAKAAALEETAPEAKRTFMQRIRDWVDSAER